MNADRLLAAYERIADAPEAIPRLRRFILDLAVRGKLVGQDPNDEPAPELLKQIAAEKLRLVNRGKIKKPKPLPEIDEQVYDIPRTWNWTRLRQIASDRGQTVPNSSFTYIDVTAINKETGNITNPKILQANEAPSRARKIVRKGDVIYSCVRPYLLNVAVLDDELEPAPIASTAFAILNGHGLVLPRYLWIVLRSSFMIKCVEERMRGQAYPAIKDTDFSLLPFPLSPLAEQHRIVAKVDELMALCDGLEAARTDRETTRDRLAAASLARLNSPDPNPATFQNHAAFALEHLTPLTTRPDQIKAIRQTILNLAVRGKLVEQHPNDGQGTDLLSLLKKTRTERNIHRLVRNRKYDPTIGDAERYFHIPNSWTWARLFEIGHTQTGSTPTSNRVELFGDYIPFVKPGDLDGSEISCDRSGLSREGIEHSRLAPVNSVLMVCIGATLGKLNKAIRPVCFNQQINSLTPYLDGLTDYVVLALKCSEFQELAWNRAGTGTLPIISKGKWELLPIPLPPLAEQHRIVAKVDKLMALCDRLEESLSTDDDTRRRLLAAVLHNALVADANPRKENIA